MKKKKKCFAQLSLCSKRFYVRVNFLAFDRVKVQKMVYETKVKGLDFESPPLPPLPPGGLLAMSWSHGHSGKMSAHARHL